MKNKNKALIILLVAAVLLSSVGTFATMAVLKANGISVTNQFSAANVFSVTYDVNGKDENDSDVTGRVPTDRAIEATGVTSHDFVIPSEPELVREGYTFQGWAKDPNEPENLYLAKETITVDVSDPQITLYAIWKEHANFTLNYDLNYTGAPANALSPQTGSGETSCVFVAQNMPATVIREGYAFAGWADSQSAATADYQPGDEITVGAEKTKTVYAVWVAVDTFKLYFDANIPEGTTGANVLLPSSQIKTKGDNSSWTFDNVDISAEDLNANDTGLVLRGWALSETGDIVYTFDPDDPSADITVTETETTLYAVWDILYYFTFDRGVNDGTVSKIEKETEETVNNTYADRITLSTTQVSDLTVRALYESGEYEYKRAGYMLVGFTDSLNGQEILETLTYDKAGLNNAQTVYAVWTEGTYALIYDANGGSDAPEAEVIQDAVQKVDITVTDEVPTAITGSGAKFLGWSEDRDAETARYVAGDTIELTEDDASKTLYAIWEYTYTLTYDPGLGAGDVPETVTITTNKVSATVEIAEGPLPERGEDEYVFQYWAVTPERQENEVKYYKGQYDDWAKNNIKLEASNPNVTLYARYRPKTGYSIKFNANAGTSTVNNMPSLPDRVTTEIFLDVTLPTTVPTRTNYTCVGWAETATATEPKYLAGETIRLNADEGCTKTLYAVWVPYNNFAVRIDYNGGQGYYQYNAGTSCDEDWQRRYTSSYSGVSTNIAHTNKSYTFGSVGGSSTSFYEPINGQLELQGFSCACGQVSLGFTRVADTSDHPSSGYIRLNNVPVDINHSCVVESDYTSLNSKSYTLTLYANWYIKDKYQIKLNNGFGSSSTPASIEKERTGGAPEHTWAAGTVKNPYSSRTGYVFLGYAYSADATEPVIFTDANGYLNTDLKVAPGETGVSTSQSGDGVNTYTMDLYAVWQTEQIFKIFVDYNGGNFSWKDDNGTPWNPFDDKTHYTYNDSTQIQQPADLNDYTFERAGYFDIPSRNNRTLLGYAYLKDATTADMPASNYLTNIKVDKADKDNPARDVKVTDDGHGMTTTTLNLYAVWEDKQEFIVHLDANGGTYSSTSYTDDATHTENYSSRVTYHTWDAGTAGSFSRPERYGYELLGYAYTQDATVPDFTMSTASGSFKLNESVTVDEADHGVDGKTVVHDTSTAPDRTTLTLYAVWEKKQVYEILFNWNGGYYGSSSSAYYESQLFSEVKEMTEDFYTLDPAANVYIPSRSGHKLLGYAYTADATTPVFVTTTTTGSYHHFENITVTKGDTEHGVVTVPTEDGVDVTTMTLYAVWEKQQFFSVQLNMSGGTISTGTGQNASNSGSRTIITTQHAITEKAYPYSTLSFRINSGTVGMKSGYALLGFAYDPSATTPDFTVKTTYNGSYDYTVTFNETVILDKEDATQTINTTQNETTGVETHTLTLYAVWEAQQWFNVKFDFNGGYFLNTSGVQTTTYTSGKFTTTPDKPSHTISSVGYYTQASGEAGYHDDGYILLGFSYAPDATTLDFPIKTTTNSSNYYRYVSSVYIEKNPDPALGYTVSSVTDETTGIETTTLTLYAVWGLELRYDVNGGTTSTGPGKVQQISTVSTSRTLDIWAGTPTYRNFKFGGWSDTASSWPKYGVQGYYTPLSGEEVAGTQLQSTYTFDAASGVNTIYATWYQEFNIHYSANGGTGEVPPSELIYVDVRGVSDVTKINHTHTISTLIPVYDAENTKVFLGWSTDPNATVPTFTADTTDEYPNTAKVDANADGQGAPVELVLYAVWQENTEAANETYNLKKGAEDKKLDEETDDEIDDEIDDESENPSEPGTDEEIEGGNDDGTDGSDTTTPGGNTTTPDSDTTTPGGGTTPPEGGDGGTTPPEGGDGGTTPPEGDDGGTTPPEGDDGTTPPTGGEGGSEPPTGGDGGTTPPTGGGTTPPTGGDDGTTPPEGGDGGTTPPTGGDGSQTPAPTNLTPETGGGADDPGTTPQDPIPDPTPEIIPDPNQEETTGGDAV